MAKFVDYQLQECDCQCDECNYSEYVEETDYSDINSELKSNGWIIKYINGKWYDFCSEECYEEFISKDNENNKESDWGF